MKKLISLLLALTMIFSLCACGKSELTPEEKEKIYEEVAAEKAREQNIVLDSDNQDDDAYLKILDVKLTPHGENKYWVDVLFQCLYPTDKHDNYPQNIFLQMAFVDKNGVIVDQIYQECSNLAYGDIAWSYAYGIYKDDKVVDLNEIDTVKITEYRFSGEGITVEKYPFREPLVFKLSELKIGGEEADAVSAMEQKADTQEYTITTSASTNDPIVVEAITVKETERNTTVNMKVRNNADEGKDVIILCVQELDRNGDVVKDGDIYVKELDKGQAGISSSYFLESALEDVSAIKVTGYEYGTFFADSKNSWSKDGAFKLKTPLTFSLAKQS